MTHKEKIKESEKINKYQDLARALENTMKHESDGDTSCNSCAQINPERFSKGTRRLWNQKIGSDIPDNNIIKIGQNTEKSSGDFRRHAVT